MVSWTRPVLNSLHSSGLMNSMAPVEKPQAGPSRQGLPLDARGEVRPSGSQTLCPGGGQTCGRASRARHSSVALATFFQLPSYPLRGSGDGGRCLTSEETEGREG